MVKRDWSTEAVQAALERGDHAEWRLLVEAVDADPWGRTARQIEEVLGHSHPFGTAELLERAIEAARARTEAGERAAAVAELRELVGRSGLRQSRVRPAPGDLRLAAVELRQRSRCAVGGADGPGAELVREPKLSFAPGL